MTTFAYNSTSGGATSVSASSRSVLLQFTDEAGANSGSTLSLMGYQLNNGVLAAGNGSADVLVGTSGNDLVLWDDRIETTSYDPFGSTARYGLRNGSTTEAIETFSMGAGNDVVALNYTAAVSGAAAYSLGVVIDGGTGNDVVWSSSGNDSLFGGSGMDTMYGGGGNDRMAGDALTDPNVVVAGGAASNADLLYGGSGDDEIWGDDVTDVTGEAGGGNDVLYGGIGNDVGDGDIGNDTLVGDDGQDALWGGAGGDTVYGGLDADVIYGGEFGAPGDVNRIYGGGGADVLYVSQDDGTDYYYGGGDGRNDELVLFGRFAEAGDTIAGDWFKAGTGVSEHDGATIAVGTALGSSGDSDVTIVYGGSVTLTNDVTGARVIFSTADVQTITLWNSDAGGPNNYQEVFEWNGSAYTFAHFA